MYNIDLQHLKVIKAIHERGSMTKASEILNLSQSSLSHHLKSLETNLGIEIFQRRNKKLWLTAAGHKMLRSAEIIISELKDLHHEIESIKIGDSGLIRISTECYTLYKWLPEIIANFKSDHPGIDIQINIEATRKPISFLNNGKIDIAIVSLRQGSKPPTDSILNYHSIFDDRLTLIVHRDHALAKYDKIKATDLSGQSILIYDADDKDIGLINKVLIPNDIKPLKITKIPLTEVILEMVKYNQGLAIMAKWLIEPLLTEDLKIVNFDDPYAHRHWYFVTEKVTSPIQQKFIDFSKKILSAKSEMTNPHHKQS